MRSYLPHFKEKVRQLRRLGYTYSEIKRELEIDIPQSTLSNWCSHIPLPPEYVAKVKEYERKGGSKGLARAVVANKMRRDKFFAELEKKCLPVSRAINDSFTAKIALAMLCWGEASKYKTGGTGVFFLGNSNPEIIVAFLYLLKMCFSIDPARIHCRVQCRADQNIPQLEHYWQKVTGLPSTSFYKGWFDKRTIGKPTMKKDYHGVLRVEYRDVKVQHELEMIAKLVYNKLVVMGPVP